MSISWSSRARWVHWRAGLVEPITAGQAANGSLFQLRAKPAGLSRRWALAMHADRMAAATRWMCASPKRYRSARTQHLRHSTSATEQLRHPGSADFLRATEATARTRRAYRLEPGAILSNHPGATARSHAADTLEMAGRAMTVRMAPRGLPIFDTCGRFPAATSRPQSSSARPGWRCAPPRQLQCSLRARCDAPCVCFFME